MLALVAVLRCWLSSAWLDGWTHSGTSHELERAVSPHRGIRRAGGGAARLQAGPLSDDASDRALARAAGVSPTTVGAGGRRFPQDIGKVLIVRAADRKR